MMLGYCFNSYAQTRLYLFEDIVFCYGDTVYIKQMQRFAKIFELCVQSIISGGMREKGKYQEEEEENEREREREREKEAKERLGYK